MIKKFIEYISIELNYSPHTQKNYQKDISEFEEFCHQHIQTNNLCTVNKKNVRSFIIHLSKKGLSKRSINRKISSLNSFYNYLLRIGEISSSPMQTIETLKTYAPKQQPISEEEMSKLSEFNDKTTIASIIVEVLYQTGIRRAELCNLRISDVDFAYQQIKITGKGNKQRVVPLGKDLTNTLQEYLQKRENTDSEYFFLTEKGKKINEKFVYLKVKDYLGTVSAKEKRSPHILRHSFATHLLNSGAEISTLKNLLGHNSLASTQVYTHANIEKLKTVLHKAHPRAKED